MTTELFSGGEISTVVFSPGFTVFFWVMPFWADRSHRHCMQVKKFFYTEVTPGNYAGVSVK